MSRACAWLSAVLALSAAAPALAQSAAPVTFDPAIARQGTTLVLEADGSTLTRDGQAATSLAIALPRGMRIDSSSRRELCSRKQAAARACPAESRIGGGRFVMTVGGFQPAGATTDLSWGIDAFLGAAARHADAATVVLQATLLAADTVNQLVVPALGTTVPSATTTTGRIVRRGGGGFGAELRLARLPAQLAVNAPITAVPSRLELALGAVRRTRQNFVRRYKVPDGTGGYTIRKIRDHRLIGHDLFRAPRTCRGSWSYELRVDFPGVTRRSAGRVPCTSELLR